MPGAGVYKKKFNRWFDLLGTVKLMFCRVYLQVAKQMKFMWFSNELEQTNAEEKFNTQTTIIQNGKELDCRSTVKIRINSNL